MEYIVLAIVIFIYAVAVWHGWKFEIGKVDKGFHAYLEQYPLKRFFKRND